MGSSLCIHKKQAGKALIHSNASSRVNGHNPQTDLECLRSNGEVIIPSMQTLITKFRALKADGPKNLHILTDYDQTLTKARFSDGTPCDSSFTTLLEY